MNLLHVIGIAALMAGLSSGAVAQVRGPGPEASLMLGPASYKLSGTGTSFAANFGGTTRLAGRTLLVEPNFGYFTYITQFGSRRHYLLPELGFQVQTWLGSVRPYFGVGIGGAIDTKGGPTQFDFTMHAASGIRMRLSGEWGMRLEVRYRSVDPFHGHITTFGIGLSRGLP